MAMGGDKRAESEVVSKPSLINSARERILFWVTVGFHYISSFFMKAHFKNHFWNSATPK